MNLYKIILKQRSRYIDQTFTYKSEMPYPLGTVVQVGFGRGNKIMEGLIVEKEDPSNIDPDKIKPILNSLQNKYSLTEKQMQTALFIKENYLSSHYEAIKLFYPPSNYDKTKEDTIDIITVIDNEKLEEKIQNTRKNAHNKLAFYETLQKYPIITSSAIKELLSFNTNKLLEELKQEKIIETEKQNVYKSLDNKYQVEKNQITLNQEQEKALEIVQNSNNPVLLHGITGSGKTILYVKLIQETIKNGKKAIVLVPEISLTPQTIARFNNYFPDNIAYLHSGLTQRQRYDQWLKVKHNQVQIVIGARSALFAPVDNLGIIIIDECHDEAYISEKSPKYDTVQTATYMKKLYNSKLVLGSATPTIEQYYKAKEGTYTLATLENRANNMPLPEVTIVDMIQEMKSGNPYDISRELKFQIDRIMVQGEQAILFINKRGYSNHLTCTNCGYVFQCENCDISLTFHKYDNKLKCHYCGYQIPMTRKCPVCGENTMSSTGTGTQKIQEQLQELFPDSKIFRIDKDTSKDKEKMQEMLEQFKNTEKSILVGTQMIGKGHHFPNVTLVGVLNADSGIYSPDYKAIERSYNIIEQVGGRAGRGDKKGQVIIQTYTMKNPMLYNLKAHDYKQYYSEQIRERKLYAYPPFGNIVRILVTDENIQNAMNTTAKIRDALNFYNQRIDKPAMKIFNPTECILTRIEKKYRYQIVLRIDNENLKRALKIIDYTLTAKRTVVVEKTSVVTVDINSGNMF